MLHVCSGPHVHARRVDPTRTVALRARFEADLARRFRRLKGLIRRALIEQDVMGLTANDATVPPRKGFAFMRPGEKVSSFMDWLAEAQSQEILGVQYGTSVRSAASHAWSNVYFDTAYRRGVSEAANKMKGAGVQIEDSWIDSAFLRPVHADRVGLIYTRAYSELEGITRTMDQQISRVLAQGIADGRGPMDIARMLNERVDKIGLTRAKVLARTEVISAHAEAGLNSYEEAGIEGVDVEAEVLTAGDDRVCEECEDLASRGPYTIDEARGLIPVHPNCRCTWVPRVIDPPRMVLR